MVKNLPANAGDERDTGLIPGLGRSPRGDVGRNVNWHIHYGEQYGRVPFYLHTSQHLLFVDILKMVILTGVR